MRVSINNSNLLKGTIVLLLFFGILGGPFSFFGTNTAEALGCVKSNITGALGFQLGTCTLQDVDSGCLAGTAACSTADRTILIALSQCDQYKNCSTAQQADQAAAQKVAVPTQCDVSVTSWSAIFNPICWGRVVGSLIGGLIVYVASWLLTISGVLFNWVLNITVVQFGQFMTSSVIGAITQAWTAFRDVSNIVIIGMFTFIAISIILGLKEFGQKKLIAHVLIIAVLINFSLLFTKMTIDASNFVATQFYNAGLSQSAAGGASSTTQLGVGNCPEGTPKSQCYGIAGAFMDYAGVAGLLDTRQATANLADSLDNGFLAFLHAIFVAVLFTAAALVLFYGTFLLVSRAVLFIFLMAVSSLAFASYLVPVWDKSRFGFGAWKNSLLMNALLAPLLMMFLWMTLNVANAMRTTGTGGTLGDLITNPTKALDINALFSYVVVLGLLFGSFKLSSSLAGKISGFSMASIVPGIGLGLASSVTGLLGRNTLGWGARTAAAAMKGAGWTGPQGNEGLLGTARRQATLAANRLGRTTYNPLKTKTAQTAGGTLGVPKMFMSKDALGMKGFEEKMKQKALAADEVARQIAPSNEQKQQAAEAEGRRRFREQKKQAQELITQQKGTRDAIVQQAHQAQPERAGAEAAVEKERKAQATAQEEHANKLRAVEERAAKAQDQSTRETALAEAVRLRATRQQEMSGEAQRIRAAQEKVTQLNEAARPQYENNPEYVALTKSIDENTKAINQNENEVVSKLKPDIVKENDIALRKALLWDKRAESNIKGAMDEHTNIQNWKNFRATDPNAGHGGGAAPAPKATPSAPAAPSTPPSSGH